MQRHLAVSFSIGILGCGAGADSHDLGSTAEHLPGSAASQDVASFGAWQGTWIGEAEDPLALGADGAPATYRFPSGESRIRLELSAASTASLVFGDATPPPAPADFDVGYPPTRDYGAPALVGVTVLPPLEGFRYELGSETGEAYSPDGVLRLYYEQNQIFDAWCAGQVPQPAFDGYDCLGAIASSYTPGPGPGSEGATCTYRRQGDAMDTPIDCNRLRLCAPGTSVCACTEEVCGIDQTLRSGLFLRASGDELVGSFFQSVFMGDSGYLTTLGAARFRRAE